MNSIAYKFDSFEQFEIDDEDELALDEGEDDFYNDDTQFFIDIKRIGDGAENLKDLAEMLRAYADMVESLDDQGFIINEPVLNGKTFAYPQEG